jgi:transcriptional regulator with XRE-family HTH domain
MHAATATRVVEALKAERRRQGISTEALAVKAGVSDSAIRHLERGRSSPTLITVLKLCSALQVSLEDIIRAVDSNES